MDTNLETLLNGCHCAAFVLAFALPLLLPGCFTKLPLVCASGYDYGARALGWELCERRGVEFSLKHLVCA